MFSTGPLRLTHLGWGLAVPVLFLSLLGLVTIHATERKDAPRVTSGFAPGGAPSESNWIKDAAGSIGVLALKQGAGRLLRDHTDYGVVVLCDPRITTKRYGKMFLQCLEPMPSTSALNEVSSFLAAHQRNGAAA